MKIIIASNNDHKIKEILDILKIENLELVDLKSSGINEDIPEIGRTLEENSLLKAYFVWTRTKKACFADDSGLEVKSLNNEPGVYSARYAGLEKSHARNNEKLLSELKDKNDRSARFRAVITYIAEDGEMMQFEGIVDGKIRESIKGSTGFGYDPLFIPDGFDMTFAELGDDVKNKISHRKNALEKLKAYLQSL